MNKRLSSKRHIPLVRHGRSLSLALGFFSRLRASQQKSVDHEDIGRSIIYMPLVGALIGALSVGIALIFIQVIANWLNGMINALHLLLIGLLIFVMLTIVSGCYHLDGLGRCADAWIAGSDHPKKTIRILKDPTTSSAAVVVITITLLVKAGAIIALTINQFWLPFLVIPALSRSAGMSLFFNTPYVCRKGLGKAFADFATNTETRSEFGIALLTGLLVPLGLLLPLWPVIIVAFVLWLWLRQESTNRLGGFTGDVFGAVIELTESSLFFSVALLV